MSNPPPLIPRPAYMKIRAGYFDILDISVITVDKTMINSAEYLQNYLSEKLRLNARTTFRRQGNKHFRCSGLCLDRIYNRLAAGGADGFSAYV